MARVVPPPVSDVDVRGFPKTPPELPPGGLLPPEKSYTGCFWSWGMVALVMAGLSVLALELTLRTQGKPGFLSGLIKDPGQIASWMTGGACVLIGLGGPALLIWFVWWVVSGVQPRTPIPGIPDGGDGILGSARWMSQQEEQELGIGDPVDAPVLEGAHSGIVIGMRRRSGRFFRYYDSGHALVFAPTGAGKGVGFVIPNLLEYGGSMFVIDPKGENAAMTARARREKWGQETFILDPWEMLGEKTARFNPLDAIRPEDRDFDAKVQRIADALVISNAQDPFWPTEAKGLLAGLIAFVCVHEPAAQRNLPRVRELLRQSAADFEDLLEMMAGSPSRFIAETANAMSQKSDKERSGVISTAQSNLAFLNSSVICETLMTSDFSMLDLKSKPVTVYLILPTEYLDSHGRWLRLLVGEALASMMSSERQKPDIPVLFLLDEFAALGQLAIAKTAFTLGRGYGAKMCPILQNLDQLKNLYDKEYRTFLSNAGVTLFWAVNELTTAEEVSRMMGKYTQIAPTRGVSESMQGSSMNYGQSVVARDFATPDEVMTLDKRMVMAFLANRRPLELWRIAYFEEPRFFGLVDRNPYEPRGALPPRERIERPELWQWFQFEATVKGYGFASCKTPDGNFEVAYILPGARRKGGGKDQVVFLARWTGTRWTWSCYPPHSEQKRFEKALRSQTT